LLSNYRLLQLHRFGFQASCHIVIGAHMIHNFHYIPLCVNRSMLTKEMK
jgi:hypothetical protein